MIFNDINNVWLIAQASKCSSEAVANGRKIISSCDTKKKAIL